MFGDGSHLLDDDQGGEEEAPVGEDDEGTNPVQEHSPQAEDIVMGEPGDPTTAAAPPPVATADIRAPAPFIVEDRGEE